MGFVQFHIAHSYNLYSPFDKCTTQKCIPTFYSKVIIIKTVRKIHVDLYKTVKLQYIVFDKNYSSIAPKNMITAFIYTMNVSEEMIDKTSYDFLI